MKEREYIIRFSHNYPKLKGQKSAKLLAVMNINIPEEISDAFREYDTRFLTKDGYDYYPLPRGKYLLLLFLGDKDALFTTIRSNIRNKEQHYRSSVGQTFELAIAESE
jgi:hypothetical protein